MMKKRIASLALILCLLLGAILPTLAESAEPIPEAEPTAEIPAEEPQAEELPEEEESLPEPEEIPQEEASPKVEEIPGEEEEEEEEPLPEAEEISEEETSPEVDDLPEEPTPEELPAEESYTPVALGTQNVQYAGVTYLSQRAFDSMDAGSQAAYVQLVDQVTEMLDRAVVLNDVVFALDKDGNLRFNISIPALQFYEDGDVPEIIEAPAEVEAAPQDDIAPAPENMELIEALETPAETIAGSAPIEESMAILDSAELRQFDTLFWNIKDYFYSQLNAEAKKFYKAGYKALVKNNKTKFTTSTNMRSFSLDAPYNAVSALRLTYPQKFDWSNGAGGMNVGGTYNRYSGKASLVSTLVKSKYYSASLEKQAQSKVQQIVGDAYDYARASYPNNPTYGLVRYFDEWICAHNYYDKQRGVVSGNPASDPAVKQKMNTEAYYYCHSAYGCLLKGYGVCESYALTMSRLLDAAGIPNLYAVGDAGGAHAWNYVQMPNGTYYLQDSTWNDPNLNAAGNTTRKYLLCANDRRHNPDGKAYLDPSSDKSGTHPLQSFRFPTLSSSSYTPPAAETLRLNESALYLAKGKSAQLAPDNGYYNKYRMSWTSSDSAAVSVSDSGKVSARKPGHSVVRLDIGGKSASCDVYVYQFTGLGFPNNGGKSSYTMDCTGGLNRAVSVNVSVLQGDGHAATAQAVRAAKKLDAPKATVDKKGKAIIEVSSATLVGDTIQLMLTPRKLGNATVTVKFAGKSAKLKLRVRDSLDSAWFSLNMSKVSAAYDGKAKKPAVIASHGLKSGRDYSVRYTNNVNAGTATVTIQGKGYYGGKIEKTFTIQKASVSGALKIRDAAAQTYNGKQRTAKPVLQLGKRTLKAGVDYEILYDGSTAAPTAAGTYRLTFSGKNYSGTLSDGKTHEFKITPVKLSKLKLNMKTSVPSNGARITPDRLNLRVLSGKTEIPATQYDVSYRDSTGSTILAPYRAGTYYVVITPRNGNITADKGKTIEKKFTIK